jgi:squalene-hopene/tetraprenyl-beta-curcumene cyclase
VKENPLLASWISDLEDRLLAKRRADGHWEGEVDLNPGPTAQAVLLHAAVDREFPREWKEAVENYFLRTQNSDGGWSPHGGASSDVSVTTEIYIASRLLGVPQEAAHLSRARNFIVKGGGLSACNPWTQLYLAFLGAIPWADLFKLPVESVLMPESSPLSFSRMAYWVKVISMPMALLGSLGPRDPLPQTAEWKKDLTWRGQKETPAWLVAISHLWARYGKVPGLRKLAQKRALASIREFTEKHGDFGGNTCTAMVVLLCLYKMGLNRSPEFERGWQCLMNYGVLRQVHSRQEWHLQCCQSLVWDTGFALLAVNPRSIDTRSTEWLRNRQILERRGDWARQVDVAPGGWCFGDRHEHFPVTDCTALALLALYRHQPEFLESTEANRAVEWLLAMQHSSGGWSAYEKYRGSKLVERLGKFKDIPNGMLDVPKADVTAKIVEALCLFREKNPRVEDALKAARRFLLDKRDARGLWKGNYGVDYLYGTLFSVKALRALDAHTNEEWAQPARDFFIQCQNPDGGWGESDRAYADPQLAGRGAESSLVQTSWALMGLCETAGQDASARAALDRGVNFLSTLYTGGRWAEPRFLGTVFPGMVYFRYELYEDYFPLMALRAVEKFRGGKTS